MDAMQISLSGLDVEWKRLQVIAQNLANMNSTRMEDGSVFQPLRLVSGPAVGFGELIASGGAMPDTPVGVRVLSLETVDNPTRTAYEPDHPHADENGVVLYPNVDHAAEMTLMIKTSRIYEANLTALSLAQQMYSRAIEIGQ